MARLYTGDINFQAKSEEETPAEKFKQNPFIKDSFKRWAIDKDFDIIRSFFLNRNIYSEQQIKENTNTKDCIDIMKIICTKKIHGRTLKEDEILEVTNEIIDKRNILYDIFVKSITLFNKLDFPEIEGSKKKKYLLNRGNAFSLLLAIALNFNKIEEIDMQKFQNSINEFCKNIPEEFKEAARNSVMDKKQRLIRNKYMDQVIKNSIYDN